jgi:DNA/RNA-binding domain of Phe-tRNA-synthetase-like protein
MDNGGCLLSHTVIIIYPERFAALHDALIQGLSLALSVKAKDYPSSIESFYKRVARSGNITRINPLVDSYNYVSLKHMLPAGSEDIDKLRDDLELTYAADGENQ